MKYDTIILAGGESTCELRKIAPYDNEALIIIGSCPMIYYVYNALKASANVNRIIISGPVEALRNIFAREENIYFVNSGANAMESFDNAVQMLSQMGSVTDKLMVLPTDIPFITPAAVNDFITRCEATEADFYYPLTSRKTNENKFPGVTRTYVTLKEGVFTGGNIFLIRTAIVDKCMDIGLKLVIRRKDPIAMAKLFGFSLVWKYFIKRLSISEIKKRFFQVTGIKGEPIISPYAEVGVDVDKPSDLILAQEYLLK